MKKFNSLRESVEHTLRNTQFPDSVLSYMARGAQEEESGAEFSEDRKYRFCLFRIWDRNLPLVMFIGLNPSTANETDSDPTIRSCGRIAKANGYGGFYMMN